MSTKQAAAYINLEIYEDSVNLLGVAKVKLPAIAYPCVNISGAGMMGEAVALESEARAERDDSVYTHTFKHPFSYQGVTIEKLTFDWGKLTGKDHLAIENELLLRGKTLVTPEFTGEFLCGMATRACTDRNGDGFRILNMEVLKAMPMRDFQTICKRARAFLLRAGS